VEVQRRLGVLNLLDLSRPFGVRYELNLNVAEEREVAIRLVKVARRIRDPNQQCFHDLRANGKWIKVKEDTNMMHRLLLATGAAADLDEPPVGIATPDSCACQCPREEGCGGELHTPARAEGQPDLCVCVSE
jgi:hypothetical protein